MAKFEEIFKDQFKDVHPEHKAKLSSNTAVCAAEFLGDELIALKRALEQQNLIIGKFIDCGNKGVVFDLKSKTQDIPSAVLRIDLKDLVGKTNSPLALTPEFAITTDTFQASILPRAQRISTINGSKFPTLTEVSDAAWTPHMKRVLAGLNTEDLLGKCNDLELGQMMYLPMPGGKDVMRYLDGSDALVIGDINVVGVEPVMVEGRKVGLTKTGDIDSFIARHKLNADEVKQATLPLEELQHLREQRAKISENIRHEMQKAGVDLSAVPTHITSDLSVEPVTSPAREEVVGRV